MPDDTNVPAQLGVPQARPGTPMRRHDHGPAYQQHNARVHAVRTKIDEGDREASNAVTAYYNAEQIRKNAPVYVTNVIGAYSRNTAALGTIESLRKQGAEHARNASARYCEARDVYRQLRGRNTTAEYVLEQAIENVMRIGQQDYGPNNNEYKVSIKLANMPGITYPPPPVTG